MKNASCSIIKYLCIKDKVLILFIGGMYIKNMNILFDLGRKGKSADEESGLMHCSAPFYVRHLSTWILVSEGCPGTNALWIPRGD